MKGIVYLIGAGPGEPELITVKGLKKLQEADVILYDFLAPKELLSRAKETAQKICVGKALDCHSFSQEEINQKLVDFARQGKVVVRLKGGDPFVFGRGSEEAIYLRVHGIDFEVIPGISAAIGAISIICW